MTRYVLVLVAVLALAFQAGCASTVEGYVDKTYDFGTVQRVAVINITGARRDSGEQQAIADAFTMQLMKKGYRAIERAEVEKILKEQKFQASEVTTSAGAAEAGRILNVDAALIANMAVIGEEINMSAKLVDTTEAIVIWSAQDAASTRRTLATLGGAVAGAGAGYAIGGDSTGKAVGAGVGGVVGGVVGHALSPSELKVAKKLVKSICGTLPAR